MVEEFPNQMRRNIDWLGYYEQLKLLIEVDPVIKLDLVYGNKQAALLFVGCFLVSRLLFNSRLLFVLAYEVALQW